MADYDGMGITEEYIDLVPILQNLYINPKTFLKNIQTVKSGTMNNDELLKVSSAADMIVCGYAFSKAENSNIRVLDLKEPHHAILMSAQGEVLETTMDDVELSIVEGYWEKNKSIWRSRMPKYFDFKVSGYYLYYTSHCIIEAMHVHASDKNSQRPALRSSL